MENVPCMECLRRLYADWRCVTDCNGGRRIKEEEKLEAQLDIQVHGMHHLQRVVDEGRVRTLMTPKQVHLVCSTHRSPSMYRCCRGGSTISETFE